MIHEELKLEVGSFEPLYIGISTPCQVCFKYSCLLTKMHVSFISGFRLSCYRSLFFLFIRAQYLVTILCPQIREEIESRQIYAKGLTAQNFEGMHEIWFMSCTKKKERKAYFMQHEFFLSSAFPCQMFCEPFSLGISFVLRKVRSLKLRWTGLVKKWNYCPLQIRRICNDKSCINWCPLGHGNPSILDLITSSQERKKKNSRI